MSTPPSIRDYDRALNCLMNENEVLREELGLMRQRFNALLQGFSQRGSHGILEAMANDIDLPRDIRLRAARVAEL
jgi:hypothetical protein